MNNDTFDPRVTRQEVASAVNGIAVDTSPGPDHVLVRAIKDDLAYEVISLITTRMLKSGITPPCLQEARTVLVPKSGDGMDISSWRPITICSVVRRVIDRILDSRLRQYISFNDFQTGFSKYPGTLINTNILRSILHAAKTKKTNVTIVFLDIAKAFDNIGHNHLRASLLNSPAPSQLVNLIGALQEANTTQIQSNNKRTKIIQLRKGVMQGSPLSPALYNLTTDHILNELCEPTIASKFGFELVAGLPPMTVLGFADDTVLIGKNEASATELAKLAIKRFSEIGLKLNPTKSVVINIDKGHVIEKKPFYISRF